MGRRRTPAGAEAPPAGDEQGEEGPGERKTSNHDHTRENGEQGRHAPQLQEKKSKIKSKSQLSLADEYSTKLVLLKDERLLSYPWVLC